MGDICTSSISITKLSETFYPLCFVGESIRTSGTYLLLFGEANGFKEHGTRILYVKFLESSDFIWIKIRVSQCSKHVQLTFNVPYFPV